MDLNAQKIRPYSTPVSGAELRTGRTYFSVTYADEHMRIPVIETLVFLGRNLSEGDTNRLYFQDADSYIRGVRFETARETDGAEFHTCTPKDLGAVFELENAIEELLRCVTRGRDQDRAT